MMEAQERRPRLATLLRDRNTIRLARIVFVIAMAVSMVLLFTPQTLVRSVPAGTDKVVHTVMFGGLTLNALMARLPVKAAVISLALYGGASEVLQAVLPIGRSGDVKDALFDLAGVALAWTLFSMALRERSVRA